MRTPFDSLPNYGLDQLSGVSENKIVFPSIADIKRIKDNSWGKTFIPTSTTRRWKRKKSCSKEGLTIFPLCFFSQPDPNQIWSSSVKYLLPWTVLLLFLLILRSALEASETCTPSLGRWWRQGTAFIVSIIYSADAFSISLNFTQHPSKSSERPRISSAVLGCIARCGSTPARAARRSGLQSPLPPRIVSVWPLETIIDNAIKYQFGIQYLPRNGPTCTNRFQTTREQVTNLIGS